MLSKNLCLRIKSFSIFSHSCLRIAQKIRDQNFFFIPICKYAVTWDCFATSLKWRITKIEETNWIVDSPGNDHALNFIVAIVKRIYSEPTVLYYRDAAFYEISVVTSGRPLSQSLVHHRRGVTYPNVRELVNCRYKHCSFRVGARDERNRSTLVVKILPQRARFRFYNANTRFTAFPDEPRSVGVVYLASGSLFFLLDFRTAGKNLLSGKSDDFIIKIGGYPTARWSKNLFRTILEMVWSHGSWAINSFMLCFSLLLLRETSV